MCDLMIKLIVFDLWQTLIPASIDFVHLHSLLSESEISVPEFISRYEKAVQLKKYKNFEELRKDFLKEFNQEDNELLESEFYEIYLNRFDKINFYPETKATLQKLKKQGYQLALLSNNESTHAKQIEDKLLFRDYFDFLCYSFEVGAIKPDKKMFLTVLNKLNVKPNEAIMVGDSLGSDVGGSASVGMHNCLIERKFSDKRFAPNIKPEFKITSLDELFKVLSDLNGSK